MSETHTSHSPTKPHPQPDSEKIKDKENFRVPESADKSDDEDSYREKNSVHSSDEEDEELREPDSEDSVEYVRYVSVLWLF